MRLDRFCFYTVRDLGLDLCDFFEDHPGIYLALCFFAGLLLGRCF